MAATAAATKAGPFSAGWFYMFQQKSMRYGISAIHLFEAIQYRRIVHIRQPAPLAAAPVTFYRIR